jgi:high-affinity nickel permease
MFKNRRLNRVLILTIAIVLVSNIVMAQCAMCRATVGSNLSEGRGVIGTGINVGILYLLFTPYLLVAAVAIVWFRASKRELSKKLSLFERIKMIYNQ